MPFATKTYVFLANYVPKCQMSSGHKEISKLSNKLTNVHPNVSLFILHPGVICKKYTRMELINYFRKYIYKI